jgi:hypothetical protein
MPTEGLLLVARQSQPKQPAMVLLPEPNALWLRCLQHPNHWYVAVPPCDADMYLTFISLSLSLTHSHVSSWIQCHVVVASW